MEFDFNFATSVDGQMTYPDYPFTDLPKQPEQIKETIRITGTIGRFISVQGSADSPDN